ncbi:hypothetical protein NC653_005394 [Populus alba x Populus x berolinensis]|uniref:Uncharacterized protein n=1 Tax=Populus alba x Populus x berolinensis TaxID=444605 RepID=A0AAD6WBT8_9ROSI|nr:hypothetical protein NC653_005394 [Populus alba x Populus x berolinensis]
MKQKVCRKAQGEMWGGELNKRNYFKPRFQSDARLDVPVDSSLKEDSRYRRLISNDRKISIKLPERHRCTLKSFRG